MLHSAWACQWQGTGKGVGYLAEKLKVWNLFPAALHLITVPAAVSCFITSDNKLIKLIWLFLFCFVFKQYNALFLVHVDIFLMNIKA